MTQPLGEEFFRPSRDQIEVAQVELPSLRPQCHLRSKEKDQLLEVGRWLSPQQ